MESRSSDHPSRASSSQEKRAVAAAVSKAIETGTRERGERERESAREEREWEIEKERKGERENDREREREEREKKRETGRKRERARNRLSSCCRCNDANKDCLRGRLARLLVSFSHNQFADFYLSLSRSRSLARSLPAVITETSDIGRRSGRMNVAVEPSQTHYKEERSERRTRCDVLQDSARKEGKGGWKEGREEEEGESWALLWSMHGGLLCSVVEQKGRGASGGTFKGRLHLPLRHVCDMIMDMDRLSAKR
jgi:hypothetical protein